MARPKLQSVKLLRNSGAQVVYATPAQKVERWVPPGGFLSVPEAALLLRMARTQVYRMAHKGRVPLEVEGIKGACRIPLLACRLLLAMRGTARRTVKGGSVMAGYDTKRRTVRPPRS